MSSSDPAATPGLPPGAANHLDSICLISVYTLLMESEIVFIRNATSRVCMLGAAENA